MRDKQGLYAESNDSSTPVPGGPKYLIAEEAGVLLFSKFEVLIKPDLRG